MYTIVYMNTSVQWCWHFLVLKSTLRVLTTAHTELSGVQKLNEWGEYHSNSVNVVHSTHLAPQWSSLPLGDMWLHQYPQALYPALRSGWASSWWKFGGLLWLNARTSLSDYQVAQPADWTQILQLQWIIIVHALFYSHWVLHYICTCIFVRYTLHCLQSIQSSLPQYYSVHSTTMVNEYLWACIGGPFLHSSLIFNCCTVEFLTCTWHSENHADPLVQSLTISNSKTKLEAAMWSNTRRTFYGYSTFSHAMANTQKPG